MEKGQDIYQDENYPIHGIVAVPYNVQYIRATTMQ